MFKDYYDNNQVQNRYSLPNGEMFIGPNIKNYTEKGKGSYYYYDGSIYKGELLKRKRNGIGEYWFSKYYYYSGEFQDEMKNGKGFYYSLFNVNKEYSINTYFNNDKINYAHPLELSYNKTVIYKKEKASIEAYFGKEKMFKKNNGYQFFFNDKSRVNFTITDSEILKTPEKFAKGNNNIQYIFPNGDMIDTYAFYDAKTKRITEKGTLILGKKTYNVEFIDDDRTFLCCHTEDVRNKKKVTLLIYENGDVYIGDTIRNSIKHGLGMLKSKDGNIFIGVFQNDINNGTGMFNGKQYRNGKWKDNIFIPGDIIIKEGNYTEHDLFISLEDKVFTSSDITEFVLEAPNSTPVPTISKPGETPGSFDTPENPAQTINYYNYQEYFVDDRYTGDLLDGKPNGIGTMYYQNGAEYQGHWVDGKRNGKGTFSFGKTIYEGDFVNDIIEGKGTVTFETGEQYIGDFKNCRQHGQGVFIYRDGSKYIGEFVGGQRNGRGKFVDKDRNEIYNGFYLEGKRTGKGTIFYHNSDTIIKYQGDVVNGIRDGNGKLFYKNGKIFSGPFMNDKERGCGQLQFPSGDIYSGDCFHGVINGYGTMTFKTGFKYVGNWYNGLMHGTGTFYLNNGQLEYKGEYKMGVREGKGNQYLNGGAYKGDFANNIWEGEGVLVVLNEGNEHLNENPLLVRKELVGPKADVYIGEFKKGEKEGKGIMYYGNGEKYVGEWDKGNKEGLGVYKYENGEEYFGFFVKNKRMGRGKFIDIKGNIKIGIWNDKKFSKDSRKEYEPNGQSSSDFYTTLYLQIEAIYEKYDKEKYKFE